MNRHTPLLDKAKALLEKMASTDHFHRFEIKDQPKPIPRTKIVEAYGLRKCPKYVEQICSDVLEVRQNALKVICDEFQNPYTIDGTSRSGVIGHLAKMVVDPDLITRFKSTEALALAANDAGGVQAILEADAIKDILKGVQDPSEVVRGNVYNCICNITRLNTGVQQSVKNGAVEVFVGCLTGEIDKLKPTILQAINRMSGDENGLVAAINSNAVAYCIKLLNKSCAHASNEGSVSSYSSYEEKIIIESSKALGFLCYDGRAKEHALENNAVEVLISLLKMKQLESNAKAAITVAIMAITITDAGKIQMFKHEGADQIMPMLYDDNKVVILNCLKIISNIAVYPDNRKILFEDSTCQTKLKKLVRNEDTAISRHAEIALSAVTWNP